MIELTQLEKNVLDDALRDFRDALEEEAGRGEYLGDELDGLDTLELKLNAGIKVVR